MLLQTEQHGEAVEAGIRDSHYHTSLHLAVLDGREAIVKLLGERADVEADSKDESGRTPLL